MWEIEIFRMINVDRAFGIVTIMLLVMACDKGRIISRQAPELTIMDISLSEDHIGFARVNVVTSRAWDQSLLLSFETLDGSAQAGIDYVAITDGQLVLPAGDTSLYIEVELIDDVYEEPEEKFTLLIRETVPTVTLKKSIATISITDTDTVLPLYNGYVTPLLYEGMSLVWQDEFDREAINSDHWTFEVGNNGWGNNELQYYTRENASIRNGNLVIEARKEYHEGSSYTSSRLASINKQHMTYGRVDIRAVLPKGQGIWPALWMLGANFPTVGWPGCGEIDIMEMIGGNGRERTVHGTAHWSNGGAYASYGGEYQLESQTFADAYHVFSIIWDQTFIRWYVDDVQYHIMDITPSGLDEFHQEFFFIFNVAVGGNWPGPPDRETQFPQRMIVDYIRVFQ
ncbi:MAG: family 16 glycosylhydrolase [Cyclobacteriaceae bacterium]|nr:family 16 glycosylhydrolase [Cyclobacteriaceae bacterium]